LDLRVRQGVERWGNSGFGWAIQIQWCISIVPALSRLGQEDHKFQANLGYTRPFVNLPPPQKKATTKKPEKI
jgi:hypothetical protein